MEVTTNADEVAAQLDRIVAKIKTPRDLIMAAVLIVERQAKARTPVDTGTLRRSVTHGLLSPTSGQVGTNVEYARFVHDGTRFMAGRPFLTDALAASRPAINTMVDRWGDEAVNA